ncbi:MAG TPA: cysteine desulfurase family protein [Hyphomicrobiaceae bacterium]|nr:cysteine desulfurase family protein [Hyphomicrobiaceae bacterium]
MTTIYLDYNATTPVAPAVLDAMLPFLRGEFGNPSSIYALGHRARGAIERARAEVARLIGARPEEIIFTSGATEAINLAIRGVAGGGGARSAIVTTTIEHPATEACCRLLEHRGHSVRRVGVDADGIVIPGRVAEAINDGTALVTVIHAQNEIGTIQPVAEIARRARAEGALMHTDAAQSVGKIPVDVRELAVDLLTIAGHKLYAPKGVGALFVRQGIAIPPLVVGADQERGLRPGTENVAFIAGLGAAARIAADLLQQSARQMRTLSALLLARLEAEVPGLRLVGSPDRRLPNTLNLLFPGVLGRDLLADCPSLMASTGSACHAGSEEPSAILTALGMPRATALGAVRLSLGRSTTEAEVIEAASRLAGAWRRRQQATSV